MEPKRITIKQRIALLTEFINDGEHVGIDFTEDREERASLQAELERDGDKWWN